GFFPPEIRSQRSCHRSGPTLKGVCLLAASPDDADVGNRVAFLERRHSAYERDDARFGSVRLVDDAARVVGDVPDLHSFLDESATLQRRIEDSVLLAVDAHDLL